MMQTDNNAKPFLKWAGGKRQLLPQLNAMLPQELYNNEFVYIEPFVGGGAMLFFMLQQFSNIKKVVINDINKKLTDAYKIIKDDVEGLILMLSNIQDEYKSLKKEESRKDFYLRQRDRFNSSNLDMLETSSLLIFLNRTCYNGLYRENSRGKFNVPFGRYVNPQICNADILYADSELLNKKEIVILNANFSETIDCCDYGSLNFFYFDPPYRPLSSTSSFNSFVKEDFNDDSQCELADYCRKLSLNNNVLWMLSNSDCSAKNPEDTFFENLYEGFNIQRVYASRAVNAIPSKRGKLTELLIRNYNTPTLEQIAI